MGTLDSPQTRLRNAAMMIFYKLFSHNVQSLARKVFFFVCELLKCVFFVLHKYGLSYFNI